MSEVLLEKARYWAERLGRIKSVEAIFLSGSLAQGRGTKESDIDFFILTTPKKIWTARFQVFTKLKLSHQLAKPHDHVGKICPNHFITIDNLEIAEKDAYSANLFSHNIPLYDPHDFFSHFARANQWVEEYGEVFDDGYRDAQAHQPTGKNNRTLAHSHTHSLSEKILRHLQKKKIQNNPESQTPGAKIIMTDQELRFHPIPKNAHWQK